MFASIQSSAGFAISSGFMVCPEMQKRHSKASIRASPIIILIVIRKENNNLWASKRLRHTCGRIVTKLPREHETAARCSQRRLDGVTVASRRVDAIDANFNFGNSQKMTLSQHPTRSSSD